MPHQFLGQLGRNPGPWRTRHTGTLYIHASKWDGPRQSTPGDGQTGAIIGRVKLVEVVDLETIDPEDYDEQDRIIVPIAEKHGLSTAFEHLEHVGGPIVTSLAFRRCTSAAGRPE